MRLVQTHAVLPALAGAQIGTVFVHNFRAHGLEEDALYYEQGPVKPPVWVGTQKLPGWRFVFHTAVFPIRARKG